MAIEYRHFEDASTTTVVTTECRHCGEELTEQQSVAEHIRSGCPGLEGQQ